VTVVHLCLSWLLCSQLCPLAHVLQESSARQPAAVHVRFVSQQSVGLILGALARDEGRAR
jgi:hypothetical protein